MSGAASRLKDSVQRALFIVPVSRAPGCASDRCPGKQVNVTQGFALVSDNSG